MVVFCHPTLYGCRNSGKKKIDLPRPHLGSDPDSTRLLLHISPSFGFRPSAGGTPGVSVKTFILLGYALFAMIARTVPRIAPAFRSKVSRAFFITPSLSVGLRSFENLPENDSADIRCRHQAFWRLERVRVLRYGRPTESGFLSGSLGDCSLDLFLATGCVLAY